MDYFISDLHLGHVNIISYERNQFDSIESHDKTVLESLKEVQANDRLFIVGDILGSPQDWIKIPGYKIFIRGNHDPKGKAYYKQFFQEVHDILVYDKNDRVLITHKPFPVERDMLNIHGHFHGGHDMNNKQYLNVSWNYVKKPLSERDVAAALREIGKVKTNHNEWYKDYQSWVDDIFVNSNLFEHKKNDS